MNRTSSSLPKRSTILVEALEPRIAPAGLLNESKFTSVVVGGSVLLDASGGPNDFQGLSTGFGGSGSYLLYLTTGKALVFTSDLNGDGKFEPGEITGIALGVDSLGRAPNLILFSDVHGDIVTDLMPGHGVSALTDSDNNPNNGRDGRVLLNTDIASITLRTITAADIDTTIPGDTVNNRLGLTSFSIYGNIYCGGNFGGLSIDTSGSTLLATKFNGVTGTELFTGATPQIGSIMTGSAANGQSFHFTQNATGNIGGPFSTFIEPSGQHGGDISNISAVGTAVVYSIGSLDTGTGGEDARGGNISNVVLHGATGSYEMIAGDGGGGANGGMGGSILNFNDLGTITGQVILHTGAGGVGSLGAGGAGGTATFATTEIAASVEVFLGNGGDGFSTGGDGASLTGVTVSVPETTIPIGSQFIGTWHDIGDVGNTHANADGTYSPEVINFNAPSYFSNPTLATSLGLADHYGDGVFTTNTPGQIEVVFGDGAGGLNDTSGNFNLNGSETVYLHVPGVVNPVVTVGDFNGDGRPDIAVASSSPTNFAGVYVFLNQIGTSLDPINAHNFSKNPLGDHPFSEAMQSAVPSLNGLPGVADYVTTDVFTGPGAILGLTSGDFNGDGITDIGIVRSETGLNGSNLQSIGILFGSAAHDASGNTFTYASTSPFTGATVTHNAGTGYFYANSASPGAAPLLQFLISGANSDVILRSTSLTANNVVGTGTTPITLNQPDVFGYSYQGAGAVAIISVGPVNAAHVPFYAGLSGSNFLLGAGAGAVDTNRLLSTPTADNVTTPLVPVTVQDFSFQDLNNDGATDIVFLSKTPVEYMTTSKGNGTTDGFVPSAINTQPPIPSDPDDNDGIYLGDGNITALSPYENGSGQYNSFGLLEALPAGPNVPVSGPGVVEIGLIPNPGYTVFYPGTGTGARAAIPPTPTAPGSPALPASPAPTVLNTLPTDSGGPFDLTINGLDAFYPMAVTPDTLHPNAGFGIISPDTTDVRFSNLYIVSLDTLDSIPVPTYHLTANGYFFSAGSGGNSTVGAGGRGGSIGTPMLSVASSGIDTAAVQITLPATITYQGEVFLLAGDGGSGFAGGGNGGSVEGVLVRYINGTTVFNSDVLVSSGNGGNSLANSGGNGGNVDHVSVSSGAFFSAGNGGSGATGGTGGNLVGNGITFDASDSNAVLNSQESASIGLGSGVNAFFGVGLAAGNGGQGNTVGGIGGSITGWDSMFLPVTSLTGGVGGSLYYASGTGGSAAAGTAGNGGSITNSSPDANVDNLAGDLHLQTGAGGNGLIGGDGGSITTFVNQPTDPTAVPGLLSVSTGGGGTGVAGSGGVGGSITTFQSNATGLVDGSGALLGIGRVIAGDGGASYAGQAGAGGAISGITAQTTSTPIVVAGGAGGEGLTMGGLGGSVTNSVINSAAQQIGKVLIVAGAGGSALSATTAEIALAGDGNTADLAHALLAFGGVTPRAGDGGNITGITQPISTQTAVDLIAGNGGSTLNAGTSLDASTGVGRGGSVVDINLAGTVGAVSRNATLGTADNPPIQAYAVTDNFGETSTLSITAIVDLIALPDDQVTSLNDTFSNAGATVSGNVGIVAGAAGTVRNAQPARDGQNGSAQNIEAESIMSIVAGSVSSVAPVSVLSGITVTDPDGVLGVDRSIDPPYTPNGQLDYFTSNFGGMDIPNNPLHAGDSLVLQQLNADGTISPITGGDGALFAITINQTAGSVLQGPRVFTVLGNS